MHRYCSQEYPGPDHYPWPRVCPEIPPPTRSPQRLPLLPPTTPHLHPSPAPGSEGPGLSSKAPSSYLSLF